jgi:hypothetical protein
MKGIYWPTLTLKKSVIYLIKEITHPTITFHVIVHGHAFYVLYTPHFKLRFVIYYPIC